jgi:putative membrane protein
MSAASELFTAQEREAIENAVASAEADTSAEIIPAVATASGRYDRAEDVFGLLVGVVALVVVWLAARGGPEAGSWSSADAGGLGLAATVIVLLLGFAVGVAVATRSRCVNKSNSLCRGTSTQMHEEVERAAGEAFFRLRLRKTVAGTGVLIYISVYERMVRVVGDDAVSQKLTQADWDEVRDLVVAGLHEGRACDGLVSAIARCGALCAEHFPPLENDPDELSNALRILD